MPEIMTLSVWWFVLLAVLCAIKPLVTFYGGGRDGRGGRAGTA